MAGAQEMSKNEFVIYCNWDPEADSAAVHAERVRESLTEIGLICPALRSWKILDLAGGTPVPLEKAQEQLDQIVARGVAAVHELESPESHANFSVIGAGRRSFRGVCAASLTLEFNDRPDPAIVAYPVFKAIMVALAPIWNVTYIQAYTDAIRQYWDSPRRVLELSWMTYLSEFFAQMITVPNDVSTEQVPGGGVLLSASAEDFDVANPEHMAAARSLRDALNPLNKLYIRSWKKPV